MWKFLICVLLLCVVGCAQIDHGEVLRKEFVPAHDTTDWVPDYNNEFSIGHSETTHHPDAWYITFGRWCEDDKYRQRTIWVSKEHYDQYEVGDNIYLK